MSYLVLARKYRPQTFDQVVNQDHVTKTLKNAISANRVAHAMLFAGPRGTGKTTIARVLAKAMNCQEGPTPVPCNMCKSCKEITAGNAADVFEIDGASNNSVDQIRELRENVKYMPQLSPYKIYIIDEVHMLSISAFNALLKTLEEPPSHVMFLFATTEAYKIPITILSRCQRHDLKRINLGSITDHMASLCAKEETDISEESLGLIAREAGGCMRDALSLLDQVISCSEGAVDHNRVLNILGVIDRKIIFDMTQAIFEKNIPGFLDMLDGIYSRGHDLKKFYAGLIEHFRNLYLIKMGKGMKQLVDVPAHETEVMLTLVKDVPETFFSQVLDLLFKEESIVKFSSQPKLAIEMIGIKMFQLQPPLPIDTLIQKLDTLRNEFYEPDTGNAKNTEGDKGVSYSSSTSLGENAEESEDRQGQEGINIKNNHVNTDLPPCPEESMADSSKVPDHGVWDKDPDKAWPELQRLICKKLPSLAAPLAKSSMSKLTDQEIHVKIFGNSFNVNLMNRKKEAITGIVSEFFGNKMSFYIDASVEEKPDQKTKKDQTDKLRKDAMRHPLVKDAIEVFNGKVMDIKLL